MFGTCSRLAAGFDLSTVGDVAFQETASIFVVNFAHMVMTKITYFTARCALSASSLTSLTTWGTFCSPLHGLNSFQFRRDGLPGLQEHRYHHGCHRQSQSLRFDPL